MVKLVNGNEVRENMERKDAGLDKIHENLYVKTIMNIRKIRYQLDATYFGDNTRKNNYYYSKLKNKLKSLNGIMRSPYRSVFYSFIIDRPADNSVLLKVYELSIEFYDNKNGELIYEYNPTTGLLSNIVNDWPFIENRPIAEGPVYISVEENNTYNLHSYQEFSRSINDVINKEDWVSLNVANILNINGNSGAFKSYREKFELANRLAADASFMINSSKYERSTIMILKLELREDKFDLNKPVDELYKDALKELLSFSNAYGLGILDNKTWINTTMEYFNPILTLHFVKLENNINNNDDIHIERMISNAINDIQNERSLHAFRINRLMVEQDVNIFLSEDGNNLESHRKYEIARDLNRNEYIVVKPEDSVYPDQENMYINLKNKDEYITKLVMSSVTGADEYFEKFAISNDLDEDECEECCCECEEE